MKYVGFLYSSICIRFKGIKEVSSSVSRVEGPQITNVNQSVVSIIYLNNRPLIFVF